jgi:hypothetical protein
MNRGNLPATLQRDNETNFVEAQRQLAECLDNLKST